MFSTTKVAWIILVHLLFAMVMVNCACNEKSAVERSDRVINFGVLLPVNNVKLHASQEPCFSIKHLVPGTPSAIKPLFPIAAIAKFKVKIWFEDSNCSDTIGPLNAMNLFRDSEVQVFFGPCCKDVLTPVAKYSSVWNTPVITPGGLTPAFTDKRKFPLLTRIMAPYDKAASFVMFLVEKFNFTYYSILYHENKINRRLGRSQCREITLAIARESKRYRHLPEPHYEQFDENLAFTNYKWDKIFNNIRNRSRRKSYFYLYQ